MCIAVAGACVYVTMAGLIMLAMNIVKPHLLNCVVFSVVVILLNYHNYSALIWWIFILTIGDLSSKSPLLKPLIINAHAHCNACVHQIVKLKTTNYIFMGKSPK